MNLESSREIEVTRKKLRVLEDRYETIRAKPTGNKHVRDLTLRSIRSMINQLKEDIVRFKSHAAAVGPKGTAV
jgi:hypothetical protein